MRCRGSVERRVYGVDGDLRVVGGIFVIGGLREGGAYGVDGSVRVVGDYSWDCRACCEITDRAMCCTCVGKPVSYVDGT